MSTISRLRQTSLRTKSFGNTTVLDFENGREGKDLKKLSQLNRSVPSITINSRKVSNDFGNLFKSFEKTSLGLGQNLVNSKKEKKFKDFPGIIDPVTIIKAGGIYEAYPVIHNTLQNNKLFLNRASEKTDGCIEVFHIRKSNIEDIATKGISGFIGIGNSLKSNCNNTLQAIGSEQILLNQPVKEESKKYFLDSQEFLFVEHTFPSRGEINNSGKKYTIDGFSGFQKNLSAPFSEESKFKNTYNHLTNAQKSLILKNSERDVSEVGTRFKSLCKGFISGQFEDRIVKTKLGTDSLSFVDLMKG